MRNRSLIVVRHGETEWNITGKLNSTTDISLSKKGRDQILSLRGALSHVRIERIISSPLKRALETARLLSRDHQIEVDQRLVEINFGPFEGKTPQELAEGPLSEAFTLWRQENDPVIPEGVEGFREAAQRAQDVLKDLQNLEGITLMISHGVFIRVLLCSCVLGMSPTFYRRLRIDNGKLSMISWEDDFMRLTKFNASTV